MKLICNFLFISLSVAIAQADTKSAMESLFPGNSSNKCSPKIIVDQKIEDLPSGKMLAFVSCNKKGQQDSQIHFASYEDGSNNLLAKGTIPKNNDALLSDIILETKDLKIADSERTFQIRLQYKMKGSEALQEELVVARENKKEISAVLRGPLEDFPGRGRAFLIITKQKTNGFADVALKSETKTEAFRWRGAEYTPFTREEIARLRK